MWKGNDKKLPSSTGNRVEKIHTLIASNVTITGDIFFNGGIQIDGVVNGNIIANEESQEEGSKPLATVRVTQQGRVDGEIHGPNVIINGRLDGDVVASQHLELSSNAAVSGNVHYNLVEIMAGAQVNGNMSHISQLKVSEMGKMGSDGKAAANHKARNIAAKEGEQETADLLETEMS